MEIKTQDLIGRMVKINIKEKDGYTSDLYNAIQGAKGKIIQKQGEFSSYTNAWLVEFDNKTTRKYAKTSNGKWSKTNLEGKMSWWTESDDFDLI